jgi:UPF0716 protein FxsA
MRGNRRWWVLALLFVVVPIVEIWLLIQLGQAVGPWWTILILLADAVLGSYLVKREGGRAWRALNDALSSGRMPARELADGALILVGGTLLITPGFVSDFLGLFCILPLTRPLARRALTGVLARRLTVAATARQAWPPRTSPGTSAGTAREDVVRGEVVDD